MLAHLTAIATTLTVASAHGGIFQYLMGGTYIQGNQDSPTAPSAQYSWVMDPVYDLEGRNITCNYPGLPAETTFTPQLYGGAGVVAYWQYLQSRDPNGRIVWAHGAGPMLAYMAACNGPCEDLDLHGKHWFKIAQSGLEDNAPNLQGPWWQGRLTSGEGWPITIPYGIPPGEYLLRHEIIVLAANPAQFYPNCVKINVKSFGDSKPVPDEYKVAIPGAYNWSDPGIALADWAMGYQPVEERYKTTVYPFPGPPVYTGK